MTDAFDLSTLAQGFTVTQPAALPASSMEDIAAAIRAVDEEQRREHRTVFCRPELADQVRAWIAAEGLAACVDVVAFKWLGEGEAYLAHTPLDENGEPAWWGLR